MSSMDSTTPTWTGQRRNLTMMIATGYIGPHRQGASPMSLQGCDGLLRACSCRSRRDRALTGKALLDESSTLSTRHETLPTSSGTLVGEDESAKRSPRRSTQPDKTKGLTLGTTRSLFAAHDTIQPVTLSRCSRVPFGGQVEAKSPLLLASSWSVS